MISVNSPSRINRVIPDIVCPRGVTPWSVWGGDVYYAAKQMIKNLWIAINWPESIWSPYSMLHNILLSAQNLPVIGNRHTLLAYYHKTCHILSQIYLFADPQTYKTFFGQWELLTILHSPHNPWTMVLSISIPILKQSHSIFYNIF